MTAPDPAAEEARLEALPRATHEGTLTIGDLVLRVYQLDNGERVIDAADVESFVALITSDVELPRDVRPVWSEMRRIQ